MAIDYTVTEYRGTVCYQADEEENLPKSKIMCARIHNHVILVHRNYQLQPCDGTDPCVSPPLVPKAPNLCPPNFRKWVPTGGCLLLHS